jgi:hypothetical protein
VKLTHRPIARVLAAAGVAGAPSAAIILEGIASAPPASAGVCAYEPVKAFGYAVGQAQCSGDEPSGTAYLLRSSSSSSGYSIVATDYEPNASGWYTPQYPCSGTYYWKTKFVSDFESGSVSGYSKFIC